MYGASIEVVEGGNEPDYFPDLTNTDIKEASEDKIELEKIIIPVTEKRETNAIKPTSKTSESQVKSKQILTPQEISKEQESMLLLKQNISSLSNEISLDMEKIQNKIKLFLKNI